MHFIKLRWRRRFDQKDQKNWWNRMCVLCCIWERSITTMDERKKRNGPTTRSKVDLLGFKYHVCFIFCKKSWFEWKNTFSASRSLENEQCCFLCVSCFNNSTILFSRFRLDNNKSFVYWTYFEYEIRNKKDTKQCLKCAKIGKCVFCKTLSYCFYFPWKIYLLWLPKKIQFYFPYIGS